MVGEDTDNGRAGAWWAGLTGRGRYLHTVVVGPRKAGKTTWFRSLAAASGGDVVVWDVRRVARARTAGEAWADLFRALGAELSGDADPVEDLEDHLDGLDRGPVLVVDDWDAAVDGRGGQVPDACYEVLDEVTRFCLGQATSRAGAPCLGLVLLTSLPDVSDLEYFARAVQRPTFERLSALVTRSLGAERFPPLDRADSGRLLAAAGVPPADVPAVAAACGGWPWLLSEAAAAVRGHGGWTDAAAAEVREQRLPVLLEASLLSWLAARPEVRVRGGDPLDYLAQELARGREPAAFGLPHDLDDPARPAPLIRQMLTRTVLVVDTENLRVPFQRHAEVEPGRYPHGVDAFLQRHVSAWLLRLRGDYDVADDDVWLIGRSRERIDATVGDGTAGQRFFLSKELRDKARRTGDSSDDNLMTAKVVKRATDNPLARFVLASGDADAPLILHLVGALRQVTVCTPWRASTKLSQHLPGRDRLRENTFPVPRPREVSPAELANARRGRQRGSGS